MAVYNSGIRNISIEEIMTVGFDPLKWMNLQNKRSKEPVFRKFYVWEHVNREYLRDLAIEIIKEVLLLIFFSILK